MDKGRCERSSEPLPNTRQGSLSKDRAISFIDASGRVNFRDKGKQKPRKNTGEAPNRFNGLQECSKCK